MKSIYPLEIFYDAQCPICRWEVDLLRRRSANGQLRFTPIEEARFAPGSPAPSREQMFARLHARRADGVLINGTDVFRAAYRVAGLGYLARASELPLLRPATDAAYRLFARHRHTLSRYFGGLFKAMTGTDCKGQCGLPR